MTEKDHHHHDHACLEMFKMLSDYIDNDLDELTCKDIERHAAECVACKACLETLKQTINLCKGSTTRSVPDDVSRRLKATIQGLLENQPRL
ncbi:MAG: zf-HC2 domain-containing protein [Desulfobacterales bacterium]|nr:zf-HC2 domain-containing protein [Desulfobacterales bacterium]MDJ0915876.1 zf-HC2 domain-containing protein [Desulfobacterales bacterium]